MEEFGRPGPAKEDLDRDKINCCCFVCCCCDKAAGGCWEVDEQEGEAGRNAAATLRYQPKIGNSAVMPAFNSVRLQLIIDLDAETLLDFTRMQ